MRMLIDLAVPLHDQAIAAKQDRRWWVTPVLSVLGSFGGAYVGHLAATGGARSALVWRLIDLLA
jgi:hypothetical protein